MQERGGPPGCPCWGESQLRRGGHASSLFDGGGLGKVSFSPMALTSQVGDSFCQCADAHKFLRLKSLSQPRGVRELPDRLPGDLRSPSSGRFVLKVFLIRASKGRSSLDPFATSGHSCWVGYGCCEGFPGRV